MYVLGASAAAAAASIAEETADMIDRPRALSLSRRRFLAALGLSGGAAGLAASALADEGAQHMADRVKVAAEALAGRMWRWIDRLQVPGETRGTLRPRSDAEPTLLACCDGAMILHILGLMDQVGPERKAWAGVVHAAQRPDGSFGSLHSFGMAVRALNCLGQPLLLRPAFQDEWGRPDALVEWLDSRDWSKPWGASIEVLHVACPRCDAANAGGMMTVDPAWRDAIFKWLADSQEPSTGLWAPGHEDEVDLFNKMGAAFHFFPFYTGWGEGLPRAEAMIDSTLSLQRADGTFAGGYADMDAVHMLATLAGQTDHRRQAVRTALTRCFDAYADRFAAEDVEVTFRDLHSALASVELLCQLARILAPGLPMTDCSGWDPRLWRVRWIQSD